MFIMNKKFAKNTNGNCQHIINRNSMLVVIEDRNRRDSKWAYTYFEYKGSLYEYYCNASNTDPDYNCPVDEDYKLIKNEIKFMIFGIGKQNLKVECYIKHST